MLRRKCSLLYLLLSTINSILTLPINDNNNTNYLESTCNNYQNRVQSFADWAETNANAEPAKECRHLLEDYLSKSLNEHGGSGGTKTFLDAGCASGRDLLGFGNEYVSFRKGSEHEWLPIKAEGFDCAQGLVYTAQRRGLNATTADFISYFNSLPKEKKFDAIFSLAALFHLKEDDLTKVLGMFHSHLNDYGVVLTTIPEGEASMKLGDGRWYTALPEKEQTKMLEDAGFDVVHREKKSIYNGNKWLVLIGQKK